LFDSKHIKFNLFFDTRNNYDRELRQTSQTTAAAENQLLRNHGVSFGKYRSPHYGRQRNSFVREQLHVKTF
jgi:hypothetical protein